MEIVNVHFKVFWRFKKYPYLKVTECKKIINSKTGVIFKQHVRGYFIVNKYIKKIDLNKYIEKIPVKEKLPF